MTDDPRKSTSAFRMETMVWQARVEAKLDSALQIQNDHAKELWGTNGSPGLSKTVDRLVQVQNARKGWMVIIGGSTIALILNSLWERMSGR